jgi:chromosome segregation ATPase
LYEEKKQCIPSLLKLNKMLEREGIHDEKEMANVLKYANGLPNLQKYNQSLQNQVQNLKYQNQKLERDLQLGRKQIAELTDVENMHQRNIDTLQNDIERLYNERSELQQFVSRFRNSNERYPQIKRIAEEVVDRLLKERKSLLTSALVAVVEALRMNPDRYAVIYNSKYDNNDNIFESSNITTAVAISPFPPSKPQNYYYNEYHEGILEIANSLLKILSNQMVDNTMVAAVNETALVN